MSDENTAAESRKQGSSVRRFHRNLATAGFILGYFLVTFSAAILISPGDFKEFFDQILAENALVVFVGVIGASIVVFSLFYGLNIKREERRFEALDDDMRLSEEALRVLESVRNESNVKIEDVSNFVLNDSKLDSDDSDNDKSLIITRNFVSYYLSISTSLEKKSNLSDRKASVLLDMGTSYAKWGIVFLIFSIIVWQTVSFFVGFVDQVIYGVVSCSLIFMFIEFLSAWFLRQYRNFVDTSTYLMKVKAIFDRFMLSYLALQDHSEVPYAEKKDLIDRFISSLGEELVWPDKGQAKSRDLGFANEAVDAMTKMMRLIKAKNATSDR